MKHLDRLKQFLRSNDPLLLVVGNGGRGKTTLLRQASEQTPSALPIVYVPGRSTMRIAGLMSQLSGVWELPLESSRLSADKQIDLLLHHLMQRQQKGVLIIDDAHLLPYSLLSVLVRVVLEQSDDCYLQCVLSGRLSFVDKVRVLSEEPLDVLRLEQLSRRDVYGRVSDFLEAAGVAANRGQINGVVNQLCLTAEGDADQLERKLQALTLSDFMHIKYPDAQRSTAVSWRESAAQNQTRLLAFLGLCCVVGLLYWQGQQRMHAHPRFLAPTQPMQFAMEDIQPVLQRDGSAAIAQEPVIVPQAHFYTVQLLGSYRRAAVNQFVQTHAQLKSAKIYQLSYQEKPWYVVGLGQYATPQAAHQALQQIPSTLSTQGAWVRSIH